MFPHLTATQQQIRKLVAHGYASKEISDMTGKRFNTINTHIRNIKIIRKLQKASEITADYWCEVFGTTLEEQRKSIIGTTLSICLLFSFATNICMGDDKYRYRQYRRNENIEFVENYVSAI